jgi:hypothetical protein
LRSTPEVGAERGALLLELDLVRLELRIDRRRIQSLSGKQVSSLLFLFVYLSTTHLFYD